MPPRRRIPTRGAPTPPVEPEQTGSSEISELRAMVAQLAESNRRQEQRIEQLLAWREAPPPTVLETPAPPVVPSVPTAPSTSSGARGAVQPLTSAEEEYIADKLTQFCQHGPARFSGQVTQPWEVGTWLSAMEKLFRDFFTDPRYRVHMAVHCLDGDADAWWHRVEPLEFRITRQLPWSEFKRMILDTYFSTSVKRKLEDDLKNLQQGDRPVQVYHQEFMQLLNCVPFVARDGPHQVELFEAGLRSEIYTLVHAQRLQTLEEAVEHAQWVERGGTVVARRGGVVARSSDQKRPTPEDGGQASSWRPPRPQPPGRGHSEQRGPGGSQGPLQQQQGSQQQAGRIVA